MSRSELALPDLDEVHQLNRLFLGFLRSRPGTAAGEFGLSRSATALLCGATEEQVERAADFPRALFRLNLPLATGAVKDPLSPVRETERRVLQLTMLHSAWHLSRSSGYSARLLLRLTDSEVRQFRHAEMQDLVLMSLADDVVRAAFDDLDWIWRELLTESRPEHRRRLLLLGLQPEFSLQLAAGIA